MAKKSKQQAGKKKKQANRPRRGPGPSALPRVSADMSDRLTKHVNMVLDPCNAVIGPTAYRGKDGFITRVNSFAATTGGATDTCGVVAYWPRHNRVFNFTLPNPATGFSIDFYGTYSALGPGSAFFGTNASETRPVAACVTSLYTGTELDRQGQVLTGVLPYKAVSGTSTIDWLAQLAQHSQRTPDAPTEVKWVPSPADEDYIAMSATQPTVIGDDNIIIVLYRNFAATKLNFNNRITAVFEWQPFYSLGLAMPTPSTPDVPSGLEVVRSTLARFGRWWIGAGESAEKAARTGMVAYRSYKAASSLIAGAARVVPMITAG